MMAFVILPLIWMFLLVPTAFSAIKRESVFKNGASLIKIDAFLPAINHQDVDNDFVNGTIAPWTDCSEDGTRWVAVEINSSWMDENSRSQLQAVPPPPPNNGKYFVMLKHDFKIFGIGIISSPTFITYPGDEIRFSYWLHSAYQHFNNIELFWSPQDQQEEIKLLELFPTSLSGGQSEWLMSTVRIPIAHPTIGKVILYGFCDSQNSLGYSIAIDDIFLVRDTSTIRSTTRRRSSVASTTPAITDMTDRDFSISMTMKTTDSSSISVGSETPLETTTVDPNTLCFSGTIDFSPCYCYLGGGGGGNSPFIECHNATLIEIRVGLFSRIERFDMPFLYLYPMDDDIIPEKLFDHDGVQFINYFDINCGPSLLEASPLAFENNVSAQINTFNLVQCNFKNLTFLNGLTKEDGKLNELNFYGSPNINETLKTLSDGFRTKILRIQDSNLLGLTLESNPKISCLQELRVTDNVMIDDDIIDVLLNWMLQTANKYSLIKFYIYNNGLKKIPTGLWRLSVMTYFRFDGNIIESGIVRKGELKFYDYTLIVKLTNCGIHTIEAGAFQGVYEITNIYLDGNNLTRLESDVYLPILEQMITYEGNPEDRGFFEVDGNPFDCVDDPCHLTWLLRDNKNTFLPFFWNAACANGTLFQSIQPDDQMFKDCP